MIGNTPAEGDWLRIMANDGTQGWCFSYNLRLFNTHDGATVADVLAESESQTDEVLETILSKKWYPEVYESLILSNTIDLARIKLEYGFAVDAENQLIKIRLPDYAKESAYTEIVTLPDGSYSFTGRSVSVTYRQSGNSGVGFIVVIVTDERGMPSANNFIAIDEPIEDIILAEELRRQNLFLTLVSSGPSFSSANYGTIRFDAPSVGQSGASHVNTFTWNIFRLLTPAIIPSNAGNTGTIEFKYFLARQFSGDFDGVVTLRFANVNNEINFFYKLEPQGLRFEDASGAVPRNNVFQSRGSSPVVAFFSKQ
jgi:hypothetical protein